MRAGITISVWESMPKYVIVVSDRKETKCMCENVYDMIIVGSGPAGLTAGVLWETCRVEGGYPGEWFYSGRSDREYV